jgi:hypothetical protein
MNSRRVGMKEEKRNTKYDKVMMCVERLKVKMS